MQQQSCKECSQSFTASDSDLNFYGKFDIPTPKLCPDCRLKRRFAFRNERVLYHRKCDLSGKNIIATYSHDSPYKVYDQDEWWSDGWDGMDYGRDFDFSRTFNDQFDELVRDVPHISLVNVGCENSFYTNFALFQKNCYLIFGAGNNEECMYGKYVVYSKDCVDCLAVYSCEMCYEGVASDECYGCRYFLNSRNCNGCTMVEDCQSCTDCIACFGLIQKKYHYLNENVGKEKFERIRKEYEELTEEKINFLRSKLTELQKNLPHRAAHIFVSENCSGDNIYNSKNCKQCFDVKDCEDCSYLNFSPKCKDARDIVFCAPDGVEFSYNICAANNLYNCMCNFLVWHGNNIFYSFECHNNNDIFGCCGLKNKQYCVFNKQYSKEDYEKLVAKIIQHMKRTGEWGEFFDRKVSTYKYNETVAQEYYPLSEKTGAPDKPFKIVPKEAEFYKKMKLPTPTKHPDLRHYARLALHNPYKLYNRTCSSCSSEIQTTYSTERAAVVFCEKCYLRELY